MKDNVSKDYIDRVRGCMLGGAIGDALGYQIEFEVGILPRQVTRFKDGKGIISDDTQMTLFTANALLWRETRQVLRGIAMLPQWAIMLAYFNWLGTQQKVPEHDNISWISKIPELNIIRDPGITCLSALEERFNGNDNYLLLDEPINDSKGCGAVMRVAPIGLYVRSDKVGEVAAYSAAITHGHPLAILSSFVMARIISHIVVEDMEIDDAVKNAVSDMEKWQPYYYKNNRRHALDWATEKDELKELINLARRLAREKRDDQEAIKQLGEGWVAEEALAIAIYSAVKYKDSFEEAVISAVNHDGDSDSTGAIAGNIIGAKLGLRAIPKYFVGNVELSDTILELADDIALGVPIDKSGDILDQKWLAKYLYCDKNVSF